PAASIPVCRASFFGDPVLLWDCSSDIFNSGVSSINFLQMSSERSSELSLTKMISKRFFGYFKRLNEDNRKDKASASFRKGTIMEKETTASAIRDCCSGTL